MKTRRGITKQAHLDDDGTGSRMVYSTLITFIICAALSLSGCTNETTDNTSKNVESTSNAADGGQPGGKKLPVKTMTASNTGAGNVTAANATDGDTKTQWSSGGPAPQWIQLDFGETTSVSKVRLDASQTPDGPTTHQIYGGPSPSQMELLGTLEGATKDNQWLELNTPAKNVRYLKITTTKSPSWVAWREIEAYK
jgi:uncharacterized protein YceK